MYVSSVQRETFYKYIITDPNTACMGALLHPWTNTHASGCAFLPSNRIWEHLELISLMYEGMSLCSIWLQQLSYNCTEFKLLVFLWHRLVCTIIVITVILLYYLLLILLLLGRYENCGMNYRISNSNTTSKPSRKSWLTENLWLLWCCGCPWAAVDAYLSVDAWWHICSFAPIK